MQFDWWTLALQTINFAILVWLLQRFLYKPVLRSVDARRVEIDRLRAEADQARQDSDKRLAELDAERAGIAAEREAALKAAAGEAEKAAAARRERAEREAAALVEEAQKTVAKQRGEALAALREASLDFGVDIARRLLETIPLDYRAEAWLDRLGEHIDGLSREEHDKIAAGVAEGKPLRVVTAVALPSPTAEAWRKHLQTAFGDGVAVDFDVDAALIAGAELHFPDAILRLSWQSQLAAMRTEIESHEDAH